MKTEEIRDAELREDPVPDEPVADAPDETPDRAGGLRWRLWSSRSRRTRILTVLVAALLVIGGAGTAWLYSGRAILGVHAGEAPLSFLPTWLPANVALAYGDRSVTVAELDEHVEMLRALYGVEAPSGKRMDAFRRDVAKSYAVSLVLDDASADRGIRVADKQARDTLSRFVSERLGAGPDAYAQFIGTLADTGTSERVVLEELKRRLAMTQLFDAVTRDIGAISDGAVRSAYAHRKDQLANPERRRISNIVVETEDDARQVLRDLSGKADFADIASRSSLDTSTRHKAGDLGTLGLDQLEKDYGATAFRAGEGELFGPVKTQHGWNVGRVEKVVPAEPAQFAEIKDDLKTQLRSEAALDRWRAWLRDTIADAGVRYAAEYRPADPSAPPDTSPVEPQAPAPGNGPR